MTTSLIKLIQLNVRNTIRSTNPINHKIVGELKYLLRVERVKEKNIS